MLRNIVEERKSYVHRDGSLNAGLRAKYLWIKYMFINLTKGNTKYTLLRKQPIRCKYAG
jgi:hypothetical protein